MFRYHLHHVVLERGKKTQLLEDYILLKLSIPNLVTKAVTSKLLHMYLLCYLCI